MDTEIRSALNSIRSRITHAIQRRNQPALQREVTLVAVSKQQPLDRIEAALAAGHQHFGENRVQEAYEKWPALKQRFSPITLHLIGPLQTNKVEEAVALFDVIESVDRPKLAEALAKELARTGRTLSLYIQINTGEEEQKSGILPQDAAHFIRYCRDELALPINGLMCIPPAHEPPAPHFALLRSLAEHHGIPHISMGMSGDFETAVMLGSTEVRVGQALFGERHSH